MVRKQNLKRDIRRIEKVKTWQLLILLILFGFLSATFLRLNNVGLTQIKRAVEQADKNGDENGTKNRLLELQQYAANHMQADSSQANPVVFLQGQYQREKEKRVKQAMESGKNSDEAINVKVDKICKPQFYGYSQAYADCVAREYAKFAPGQNPVTEIEMPDVSEYRHSFTSPMISFDFAGASVIATLFIAFIIILRLVILAILLTILKFKSTKF